MIIVLEAIPCKVNMDLFHLLDTYLLVSLNNWDKLLDLAKLEEKNVSYKSTGACNSLNNYFSKISTFLLFRDYFLNKFLYESIVK